MKKIIVGIAIVCNTFFYCGCKSTENTKIDTAAFVGTWVGESYSTDVKLVSEQILKAGETMTKATAYNLKSDSTFTEKVFGLESWGTWEYTTDSSVFIIKYIEKKGPNDRKETRYNVVSINDSLLVLQFQLSENTTELYTYRKQK